ncbi:hypothetical protein K458DRAFT_279249, partial [Lentithecium fluviatile CBS 122367]
KPINRRAWTFQEQALAQRVLFYASHTLQWRYKSGTKNLGNSLYEASGTSLGILTKEENGKLEEMRRWHTIINIYSMRDMSLPEDKLPAIAGLTERFSDVLGPEYYAGIWSNGSFNAVLNQLCWRSARGTCTRPNRYRAPSWSWAS